MPAMKTPSLFRWFLLFSLIVSVTLLRALDSGDTPPDHGKPTGRNVYPIKEGFVDVNGLFLYYTELGEGQPLIVLHGGPGLSLIHI